MKKSGLADSPFFRPPAPPAPVESVAVSPVRSYERTPERTNGDAERTPVRVFERSKLEKRPIKRHAFEIYDDQLNSLKKRKAEAMLRGEEVSMSAMLREALDLYLKKTA